MSCDLLLEQKETPDLVSWSGQVLDGPYTGENSFFTDGEFLVEDLEGKILADPVETKEGTWRINVPPEQDLVIRLNHEKMIPALWRGKAPPQNGMWFTGALFAYSSETWASYFEQFEDEIGLSWRDLDQSNNWFWGSPLEPEIWAGAEISLIDGESNNVSFKCYTVEDNNLVVANNGPIHYIMAFDLVPGDITLSVHTTDGSSLTETWPSVGGEIITAWYLALSESE